MSTKELEAEVRKELQNISLEDPVQIVEKPGPSTEAQAGAAGPSVEPEPMEASDSASGPSPPRHNTTILVMLGMAGSGKTSWTQRFAAHLLSQNKVPYIVNLDPACEDPPFPVNIDIRDTINFSKVMTQYKLGPNGAIVTALNLFATKFDQVLELIKERSSAYEYILIDTPGQLECFLWSASGQIMLQSLAAIFPTVVAYVSDLVRCASPITFVSNMMYGISILFKNRLPLIITLNKADMDPSHGKTVKEWITDWEQFEVVLRATPGYSASFASSLALSLEEFYATVDHVAVSAKDGFGAQEFANAVLKAVDEYETIYVPMYAKMREVYLKKEAKNKTAERSATQKSLQTGSLPSSETRPSMELFVKPAGSHGGLGFDLMWGNNDDGDDDSSASEQEVGEDDEDEDDGGGTLGGFLNAESARRTKRQTEQPNAPGPSRQ